MEVCVCIAITTNKTQGVAMTRLLNQLSEIKTYTPSYTRCHRSHLQLKCCFIYDNIETDHNVYSPNTENAFTRAKSL